ncbi:MAG: hypothetical protein ABI877_11000 [Gemmatimonadaceae bacterium]
MTPNEPGETLDAEYERDHLFALELAAFFDDLDRAQATLPDASKTGSSVPDSKLSPGILKPTSGSVSVEMPPELLRQFQAIGSFIAAEPGTGRGLHLVGRMVLLELLAKSRDLPDEQVVAANKRFARLDLPTLETMRTRAFDAIPTVLTRGKIESEGEYYFVMARLIDPEASQLSSEQRDLLAPIVSEYEHRTAGTRPVTSLPPSRPAVRYETVPMEDAQLWTFDRALSRERFPIDSTSCWGKPGGVWHGALRLKIDADDLATRQRIADWLRSRAEITSVEIDTSGPWTSLGANPPPQ